MGLWNKEKKYDKELYDKFAKTNIVMAEVFKMFSLKRRNKVGTAFLHERVGKTEIFHGAFPILKSEDEKLGKYHVIDINGRMVFVDHIPSDYWTPSTLPKIMKFVELVKFAEDDFRVRSRVKEDWYSKKPIYKYDVEEIERVNEDTGETEVVKLEKPVFKDGKRVVEKYEWIKWEYPKMVSQKGREAMRIGNEYEQRMREKRNRKNEFWEKYGTFISMTVGIVIICATLITTTKLNIDAQKDFIKEFRGEMDEVRESSGFIDVRSLAEEIANAEQRNKNEEEAPPR